MQRYVFYLTSHSVTAPNKEASITKMKIEVERVIGGKNPKLLKVIPKFLITRLKKLIHQNEINEVLEECGHLSGREFAGATLKKLNIEYTAYGEENIKSGARYIVVSNHPLGGLDGIVLIELFGKLMGDVRFVVNDLLYHIEPLKPVFIPVNKYGKQSHDVAEMVNEYYNSDCQILYFPAGLCSRLVKGKIEDLEWKKSYITQAIKYKRDILPVYFEGKNSSVFYRLANLRKWLGIKFNYETLLLPHEMFRQKSSSFNVYIREPITYESLISGKRPNEWNRIIRDSVYSLKEKNNGTGNSASR